MKITLPHQKTELELELHEYNQLVSLFMSKIEFKRDSCWNWKGTLKSNHYGVLFFKGKHYYAHRLSHQIFKGRLNELDCLHSCDNPSCVNPDHLRAGTHRENMVDNVQRGEKFNMKLTVEMVKEIKELMKQGHRNCYLAKRYGVVKGAISNIRCGKAWAHV